MKPQFPLYVVSKGRHESRLTATALEDMGVPYNIVVEEQEYDDYAKVIKGGRILVLDKKYQREYDTFSNIGAELGVGPGPTRNFAWDHSMSEGHSWHWVMDDNINGFLRFNKNMQLRCRTGGFWKAMEDFVLRYSNVLMAGPNYYMFVPRKTIVKPFVINTRIYSCNLIRNDCPFRWRGRYNEDTDLSLRILKAGYCTIQFNAFLQLKSPTQTIKGGNTDSIYKGSGEKNKGGKYAKGGTTGKSQMLVDMHPDVAKLKWKFGRWHHEVDYSPFKSNALKKRKDLKLDGTVKNYGMDLVRVEEGKKVLAPSVIVAKANAKKSPKKRRPRKKK